MSEGQNPSPSYWSTVPYPVLSSRTLSDKTKLVYGVIASLTQAKDEDGAILGYCYASNAYLAEIMGCGERTITRSVAELVDAGELIVRHVGTNKTACKHQRRIYTLETYARSIVKSGEVAIFDYAGIDKNGEALINRIDNKRNDNNPPEPPTGGRPAPEPAKWKPERFEAFWAFYRQNVNDANRSAARKAWDKLKPDDATIDAIALALVTRLRVDDEWRRGIGRPHASTYLNGRMWLDTPATQTPPAYAPEPQQEEAFGVWH